MLSQLLQFVLQNWSVVAVLAGVALIVWFARNSGNDVLPAFEKRGPLVTEGELKFYKALQAAVGGSWSVFAMVRLADIVKVRRGIAGEQAWRNKSFGKNIDFVLCDNDSLNVCLAIELDDASHRKPQRRQSDQFKADALAAAGLPLLRIDAAEQYDKIALRKTIDGLLKK